MSSLVLVFLQVQNPILDLLGASLVPELGADVAAGSSGHVHLVLVGVAALGADPYQLAVVLLDLDLAVIAADLAVVGLGVQLGVDDVVVNELHHLQHGLKVVLHIGDLDVADRAAGREVLELRLELELGEGVDRLGDVDMVAVGDIALVGHALDDAEALLQALGKLVGRGLQRRAVEGIVDVLGSLPLLALVVHLLHDGQGERRGGGVGMALAGHVLHALIESGVAEGDGGVAVVEQAVDGFALLETGAGTILPEDGRGVGERTAQTVVAAAERTVAQLEPVFKNIPEFFDVTARGERDVGQIDGHDALIEAAVVLVLARLVVAGVGDVAHARVGEAVGREEAAAAHTGIHIALELEHFLFADVIGHHAARRAFCGELREIIVG